jgi:hypothetical protein
MSKSNATETDILAKIFTATALPWDSATDLDIHLHVGDPGEAGTTATSPATYTGYAPVTVARSGAGWTVTGNTCVNDGLIQFGQCTAGTNVLSHVSITPASSSQILYSGALNANLSVSAGIQPQFAIGALQIQED